MDEEALEAALQVGAEDHDLAAAAAAAQTEIHAQTDDFPLVGTAGVRLAELEDVADGERAWAAWVDARQASASPSRAMGTVKKKVLPLPATDSTQMQPPWPSIICLHK